MVNSMSSITPLLCDFPLPFSPCHGMWVWSLSAAEICKACNEGGTPTFCVHAIWVIRSHWLFVWRKLLDVGTMNVGSGCVAMLLMLLVVTMVTTLGSSLGVTTDVSTATNLSSSMSAWRTSSSGGTHHHGDKKHKEGNVTVGLILPHTRFGVREYIRSVRDAVEKLTKSRGPKLNFLKNYEFSPKQVHSVMMTLTPSPTGKYTIYYDRRISYRSSSPMAVCKSRN